MCFSTAMSVHKEAERVLANAPALNYFTMIVKATLVTTWVKQDEIWK